MYVNPAIFIPKPILDCRNIRAGRSCEQRARILYRLVLAGYYLFIYTRIDRDSKYISSYFLPDITELTLLLEDQPGNLNQIWGSLLDIFIPTLWRGYGIADNWVDTSRMVF